MYLSKLKPLDEITVELVHPVDGTPLFDKDDENAKNRKPLSVTVKSKESETSKKITRQRLAENSKKARINQKKNKDLTVEDIKQLEAQNLYDLAELTVGVHIVEEEGKFVELSDMKRIYAQWPWIKQQVEEALADKGKSYEK